MRIVQLMSLAALLTASAVLLVLPGCKSSSVSAVSDIKRPGSEDPFSGGKSESSSSSATSTAPASGNAAASTTPAAGGSATSTPPSSSPTAPAPAPVATPTSTPASTPPAPSPAASTSPMGATPPPPPNTPTGAPGAKIPMMPGTAKPAVPASAPIPTPAPAPAMKTHPMVTIPAAVQATPAGALTLGTFTSDSRFQKFAAQSSDQVQAEASRACQDRFYTQVQEQGFMQGVTNALSRNIDPAMMDPANKVSGAALYQRGVKFVFDRFMSTTQK